MKYHVYTDDSEVVGHSILSMVECIRADDIRPILEQHRLGVIEPDRWYPLQSWLNVFSALSENGYAGTESLVSIGMAIVETAVLPPEFNELPFSEIIKMIDQAYKMNNRGTDIGAYLGEVINEQHVQVTVTAPYPDDYNYGILYGFARRYLIDKGFTFTVYYDEEVPRREQGGAETIIHVVWQPKS